MKSVTFMITITAALLLLGSLIVSLIRPTRRIWPPPSRDSWQFRFSWALADVVTIGIGIVTVLDWNTFVVSHWSRFVVGVPFVAFGIAFPLWSVRTLGKHASMGQNAELVIVGPYAYSRNPEYVGRIALLIGVGLISNSLLSWIACSVASLWFLVAPFAEEPWLFDQYGEEYDNYRSRVRRFL